MKPQYHVHAEWDPEARVWTATSDDVPGLVTEADDMETLVDKLKVMIPELLELNGVSGSVDGEIPFHLVSERSEVAHR